MTDEIIYMSGNVKITNAIAIFDDISYPINGVTAVSIKDEASPLAPIAGFCLFGTVGLIYYGHFLWAIVAFASLLFFAFGSTKTASAKLVLATAGGEQQVFSSTDKALLIKIKEAVELAVTRRSLIRNN